MVVVGERWDKDAGRAISIRYSGIEGEITNLMKDPDETIV